MYVRATWVGVTASALKNDAFSDDDDDDDDDNDQIEPCCDHTATVPPPSTRFHFPEPG